MTGQWIESVTDWAIRITDWCLSTDWTSSRARLLDPIRPMPDNGSFEHPGSPIALISRLPDWAVQSVLPIAIPPIAPSILSTGQCDRQLGMASFAAGQLVGGRCHKATEIARGVGGETK